MSDPMKQVLPDVFAVNAETSRAVGRTEIPHCRCIGDMIGAVLLRDEVGLNIVARDLEAVFQAEKIAAVVLAIVGDMKARQGTGARTTGQTNQRWRGDNANDEGGSACGQVTPTPPPH